MNYTLTPATSNTIDTAIQRMSKEKIESMSLDCLLLSEAK